MAENKTRPFSIDEEKPNDWFEPLYANANQNGDGVPWANMDTHPSFKRWLERNELSGQNKRALVVGCGLGDDAIELEALGFQVTAFDVSDSAIKYCKERFPTSTVDFVQADLLKPLPDWQGQFDFVLEIFTVQALPPKYEEVSINAIGQFVAPGGQLLTVAVVGDQPRDFQNGPPWVLTPEHIDKFVQQGFEVAQSDIEGASPDKPTVGTYVTEFVKQN